MSTVAITLPGELADAAFGLYVVLQPAPDLSMYDDPAGAFADEVSSRLVGIPPPDQGAILDELRRALGEGAP